MKLLKKIGIPSIIMLLMQLSMYPYALYRFFSFPEEKIMRIVFFVIIAIYCLFIKNRHGRMPKSLTAIMVMQSIVWIFYFGVFNDTSYLTRLFFIALTYLALSMLIWKNSVKHYLDVYSKWLTMQGCLGIIAFVLVFIGVLNPLISLPIDDGYGSINFYGITCSNAVFGNFMRVGGFFDEPGALAFWGMFALLFNKLTNNNRKVEIALIVSLFFTFSAAYFILLPLYLLCFYSSKIKSMVLTLLIIVPLLFIVASSLSDSSEFLYYTVERFSGDQIRSKRYSQSEEAEAIFKSAPVFGQGAQKFEEMGETKVTDNPYEILAKDGVVGFVITYLPLFYVMIKFWRKKEVIFSSGILLLDYMQRPFHINEMHYFMLYLFCLLVVLKYGNPRKEGHLLLSSIEAEK